MKAITVTGYGGADVLELTEREPSAPGHGEVRVAVEAAGINFADIMQRRGSYPGGPDPPYVPGMEAAGEVDAVGEGVEEYAEGDRVVAMTNGTAYAEYAVAGVESLFPVPAGTSFAEAAGFPVQYLTAHGCLFGWGGLEAGERVLVNAAAGGVGTAAVQLASRADAEVFGTASTERKRDLAAELGADHTIDYTERDVAKAVTAVTDEGLDLVLDGVGGDAFEESYEALAHFGRLVVYGVASGDPRSPNPTRLLFENKRVIGYHLGQALSRDPDRVFEAVPDLTEGLRTGELSVVVGKRFALEDAAAAHEYIEDRASVGKVVLEP